MSKRFTITPPNWPRELTFEEFKKSNPLITENQLIPLYNQYLTKFLSELKQQKVHFKQSKINHLLNELKESNLHENINVITSGGTSKLPNYALEFTGFDSSTARADIVTTQFNPNDPTGVGFSSSDRKPIGESGFTISYWVRPDEAYTDSFHIGWKENTNSRFEFGFKNSVKPYISVGGNQMSNVLWNTLFVNSGNTDLVEHLDGDANLILGRWYHIVVSYVGTDGPNNERYRRVYFNGKQIRGYNSEAIGTDYNDYFNVDHVGDFDWGRVNNTMTQGLSFGSRAVIGSGTHTDGLRNTKYNNGHACALDEIAIYNEVKNNDWVRSVYNDKANYNHKNEDGLLAYWKFNEGTGLTVKDLGPYGYHGTLTNASYGTTIDSGTNSLPPTGTPLWIKPPNNYGV